MVYAIPSLQLGTKVDDGEVQLSEYPYIFIIWDAANMFGALKSGGMAWGQVSDPPHASGGAFTYAPSLGRAHHSEYCTVNQRKRLQTGGIHCASGGDQGLVGPSESSQCLRLFGLEVDSLRNFQRHATHQTHWQTLRRRTDVRPWASTAGFVIG